MFQKIPVELTRPPIPKEKTSIIITCYWRWLVYEKLNENLPPLKKIKPREKSQEKEYEIKRKLQTDNQNCNDQKFQIHWNKLEWENPRNCNEQKNPYCVSSKDFYLKDNNKAAHWVGQAK